MCAEFNVDYIVRELERMGVTAIEFCRKAKLPESTWRRAKNERRDPRDATKRAFMRSLAAFQREHGRGKGCSC